jgi:hypothetical protein
VAVKAAVGLMIVAAGGSGSVVGRTSSGSSAGAGGWSGGGQTRRGGDRAAVLGGGEGGRWPNGSGGWGQCRCGRATGFGPGASVVGQPSSGQTWRGGGRVAEPTAGVAGCPGSTSVSGRRQDSARWWCW